MKLVTWNVNSIRSRLERVLEFLKRAEPDILCLQELKATDDIFSFDVFKEAGYHATVHGQKTYNGVAILSRSKAEDVRRGLEDGVDDPQARIISAEIDGVRVINGYFPNGQAVGSEKWEYKLAWMDRLHKYLDKQIGLTVRGSGFKAGEMVNIDYDNLRVATATADNNGAFSTNFNTPASAKI